MSSVVGRDVGYSDGATTMLGYFCSRDEPGATRPGVLMIHGGFGLVPQIMENASRLAELGFAVLAADLWGERYCPPSPAEFSAMIQALDQDRPTWMGRLDAACDALVGQPEVSTGPVSAVGYCFGGSSVLELARTGRELAAVVSLHGGLADVGEDWTACGPTSVLILTGADDAMATPPQLRDLQRGMSAAAVDWETDVYSATDHAFTFPGSPNYNGRSDRRSWASMVGRLTDVFPDSPNDSSVAASSRSLSRQARSRV